MSRLSPLVFLLCLVLAPLPCRAKIYKYVDGKGVTVFVDDESRIPPQFRGQAQSYREELDHLTPEQRREVLEERRLQRRQAEEAALRQQQQAARQASPELSETPVVIRNNQVLVAVQVGQGAERKELTLLLDTGATHTVLHRDAVESLDLAPGKPVLSQLAGGQMIESELVNVGYLRVGPIEQRPAPVLIIDHRLPGSPVHGLLGLDFLKQHPHQIDYQRQRIRWQP